MTEPLKNQHLVREWEQAWSHYRHLESTRSQYLGFFFTVQLALVGLGVGLAKDIKPDARAVVIFGFVVLAFIDLLITVGLFTAIKKMGYVLCRYAIIMATVRKESGVSSSSDLPFDLGDMNNYPRLVLDAGLFSVQRSAEAILAATSFLLMSLLVVLAVFLVVSAVAFSVWQKWVGMGIAVSSIAYVLAVFVPLLRVAAGEGGSTGDA